VWDSATLLAHPGPPSVVATWRESPLEVSDVEFDGEDGHRQFARAGDRLLVRHRRLVASVGDDGIAIGGTGSAPEELLDDFQTVFASALTYWLALRQHFPIHCAAVGRDGAALLLLGRPGNGKSSAVWGAHHAGMDLIADDTAFVRRGVGGYEIMGMRKPVAIPRDVLGDIPEGASQDYLNGGGSRDRWALPPDMLAPGWHRLVGIVTPEHGQDPEGALTPRDRATLLRLVIGTYYAADDESQLKAWFPHAAALTRLPAWDLHHSPDPANRLEVAARWIAAAFDEATSATKD
jgi:hypothetical protein